MKAIRVSFYTDLIALPFDIPDWQRRNLPHVAMCPVPLALHVSEVFPCHVTEHVPAASATRQTPAVLRYLILQYRYRYQINERTVSPCHVNENVPFARLSHLAMKKHKRTYLF
jgi:hypothetical protein